MNSNIQDYQTKQNLSKKLKNLFTFSLLAGSMVSLVPATALGKNHQPPPDLFDDFGIQQSTNKMLPAKADKGKNRSVNVHTDLIWSDALTLNLFDDVTVTAVRDRIIDNVKGNTTWIGHVEGEQDSDVFLTVRGKTMSGSIQIGQDLYEIETKGNNKHDITQVDPDKNPPHSHSKTVEDFIAAGGEAASSPTSTANATTSAATAGTIIDLMVIYTPKAKTNASGQTGIETKIANAVAMANQAYINSNIAMQLNVVYTGEISYVETGNMSTSLTNLTSANDGKMDAVHTLRNQYGADQVVLITADTNYCGIAYVMQNVSTSFAPYAFSVVHDDSTYACLSNSTLAHELGHNQGDLHDRASSSSSDHGAYDYSYGYRLCQTGGFRTVMSYSCNGGTRVNYFSNPNVTLSNGLVTGTATENNALSMTNTKAIVTAFRATVSAAPPAAPGNLKATVLSDSEISLAWSDNSSDETGFRLERSTNGINWTEFAVTAGNIVSFIDTGLAASTSYQYRARAYNSNGNSSYSNIGTVKTNAPIVAACTTNTPALTMSPATQYSKPGAALTYSINLTDQDSSACSPSSFTLTNSDGTILGTYLLSAGSSTPATWATTAPTTEGSSTKSVTASAPDHADTNQSVTVIVDTTAPTAPGSLKATVNKRNQTVNLSWIASTDTGSGLLNYVIQRNNTTIGATTATSYTNKSGKGTFTYTVEAVDKTGNSKGSSISVIVK